MREWKQGQWIRFRTLDEIFSKDGAVRFSLLLLTIYILIYYYA